MVTLVTKQADKIVNGSSELSALFKCAEKISLASTGPKPTFGFVNSEYKADKLIQCAGIFVQSINIRSSSRLLYVRELAK